MTLGMSISSGVGLSQSAIVGMRPCLCIRFSNLSVHGTAHPMSTASVHPRSAANCLIRSAVDISHPRRQGNPPASSSTVSGPVRSDILNGLGAGAVGGVGNPSLVSSTPPGVFPVPVDSASAPPSSGCGNYLPTQSQESYRSALRVPVLVVPPLALTAVSTRKPMYARILLTRQACQCLCERCDNPCQRRRC